MPPPLPPRTLDAVDLALMQRQSRSGRSGRDMRWSALVGIVILFVALMVLGFFLAASARPHPGALRAPGHSTRVAQPSPLVLSLPSSSWR